MAQVSRAMEPARKWRAANSPLDKVAKALDGREVAPIKLEGPLLLGEELD
jgi:hypothetical protein